MADSNPGSAMAAEIDEEAAKFRQIQQDLQKVGNDIQIVMGQIAENEMVQQELELLDGSSNVYKMVGPVLIKNSLEDARDTVSKRLEFINSEKEKLETKAKELETTGTKILQEVQQKQALLQQATAAAVQEVAKEHNKAF